MDIKHQPRPVKGEENLASELKKLFTEEWGGPKSALALAFLSETVIPDLIKILSKNWHFLDNITFREILIAKLNTQFAYPATFAEGLADDIITRVKQIMGVCPFGNNNPWQPWEIILRMITINYRLPEIADKTGYPEAYLDLFCKRYLKVQELYENLVASEEQLLSHRDLSGAGIHLIRYMVDFRKRFMVFKNYFERLQAEQIIMELEYNLDPDRLIRMFEGLFEVERQVSVSRFVEILKGSKSAWLTSESYYSKTMGYGLLNDWTRIQITSLLSCLKDRNLIIEDNSNDQVISLSEESARLIAPLVVPKLADEVRSILHSKAKDKIARSTALIQGINPEIAVQVIGDLVQRRDPSVAICLKALHRRVSKKVFLQIIWGCGELGGREAISLLSKTILDRDSVVRVRTCQAIGQLQNPSFYFSLINALDDPVATVRENAALALGKLKMTSALKYMERIIESPVEEQQVKKAARITRVILLKEKSIKDK